MKINFTTSIEIEYFKLLETTINIYQNLYSKTPFYVLDHIPNNQSYLTEFLSDCKYSNY